MKKIVIGCDNVGVGLKKVIIKILEQKGIKYEDVGVEDEIDNTIYPLIAESVCKKIIGSAYQKEGLLICGTGIGMAISANKFPGIYAAVCHDTYSAERARLSNDSNVMTMGARVIGPELAKKIVEEWLSLEFVPGSSSSKVQKIKDFERSNFKSNAV